MLSSVSKIYFSQPNTQTYNKRIHFYLDDGEIEKISVPYLQEDTFNKNNEEKVNEVKANTIISALLGGGIGLIISKNQKLLSKFVVTSIGALTGIGISAYCFAKNLANEHEMN